MPGEGGSETGGADRLARLGLEVAQQSAPDGGVSYVVRGDTYPLNDYLEAAGAAWNSDAQAWQLPDADALGSLVREISAAEPPSSLHGLSEASVAFDALGPIDPLTARFLDAGPNALKDGELLQLILSFGDHPRAAEGLSRELLSRFGGLGAVLAAEPGRLSALDQIGQRSIALLKAVQVAMERVLHEPIKENPVIGSWNALIDYLHVALRHKATEQLLILYLDRKNRLIRDEVHQQGTVDHIPLYPREIVKRALELAASAIIMVHNHPSGDPTPSRADIDMTRQVVRALETVAIAVHDHVIVGRGHYLSFRSKRLI